jgi:hypothetical protein
MWAGKWPKSNKHTLFPMGWLYTLWELFYLASYDEKTHGFRGSLPYLLQVDKIMYMNICVSSHHRHQRQNPRRLARRLLPSLKRGHRRPVTESLQGMRHRALGIDGSGAYGPNYIVIPNDGISRTEHIQ